MCHTCTIIILLENTLTYLQQKNKNNKINMKLIQGVLYQCYYYMPTYITICIVRIFKASNLKKKILYIN